MTRYRAVHLDLNMNEDEKNYGTIVAPTQKAKFRKFICHFNDLKSILFQFGVPYQLQIPFQELVDVLSIIIHHR